MGVMGQNRGSRTNARRASRTHSSAEQVWLDSFRERMRAVIQRSIDIADTDEVEKWIAGASEELGGHRGISRLKNAANARSEKLEEYLRDTFGEDVQGNEGFRSLPIADVRLFAEGFLKRLFEVVVFSDQLAMQDSIQSDGGRRFQAFHELDSEVRERIVRQLFFDGLQVLERLHSCNFDTDNGLLGMTSPVLLYSPADVCDKISLLAPHVPTKDLLVGIEEKDHVLLVVREAVKHVARDTCSHERAVARARERNHPVALGDVSDQTDPHELELIMSPPRTEEFPIATEPVRPPHRRGLTVVRDRPANRGPSLRTDDAGISTTYTRDAGHPGHWPAPRLHLVE